MYKANVMTNRYGGVVVETSEGLIQFGAPPLTIKDAFARYEKFRASGGFNNPQLDPKACIPHHFIYDPQFAGPSVGFFPLQFLQYMPFVIHAHEFFHSKDLDFRMNFIVPDAETKKRLLDYLRISLLGPDDQEFGKTLNELIALEYPANVAKEIIPDMRAGIYHHMSAEVSDLCDVICFEKGTFKAGDVVINKMGEMSYQVIDQGVELGKIDLKNFLKHDPLFSSNLCFKDDVNFQKNMQRVLKDKIAAMMPITTDHGFACGSSEGSSGCLIWNHGQTVIVDPPAGIVEFLKGNNIPLSCVEGMLITHGHGDHFTEGAVRLLEELPNIKIYSSPVVLKMIKKQYEQALNLSNQVTERWNTVAVNMHEPVEIIGLWFRFDYGFHSIPSFGFEIWTGSDETKAKLMLLFTGDSYFGRKLCRDDRYIKRGIMTEARRQSLMRVFHLITKTAQQTPKPYFLIEAGFAPIHTPAEDTLNYLKEHVNLNELRLLFYHNTDKSISEISGARKWQANAQGFIDLSQF